MNLRILLKISFLLLIDQIGIAQSFNESFIMGISTDQGHVLKLNKNNTYKYYIWNGYAGNKTLSAGNYIAKDGLITFDCIEKDSTHLNGFPNKLYFRTIRLNKYKIITNCFSERRRSIFGQKYFILSSEIFRDSFIKEYRPNTQVILTKEQFRKRKDKSYFLSESKVYYKDKWNHKKIKDCKEARIEESNLFKEIYSTDKSVLRKYEFEIKNTEAVHDYGPPFQLIYFNDLGEESEKFEFYIYSDKLNKETLLFLTKLQKLFDEI